jgi:hypothetical protein
VVLIGSRCDYVSFEFTTDSNVYLYGVQSGACAHAKFLNLFKDRVIMGTESVQREAEMGIF